LPLALERGLSVRLLLVIALLVHVRPQTGVGEGQDRNLL
jgi:hypothetical protein